MQKFLIFLLSLVLAACEGSNNSFYTYYAEEDLYRLPLIKPYKLINLYGFKEGEGHDSWQINFHYGGDKNVRGYNNIDIPNYKPVVLATDINISKEIIFGYDPGRGEDPPVWFIIIPDQKLEKVFKNEKTEWQKFLKKEGVVDFKLYRVWPLFEEFKKSHILPWYNPKKGIYPEKKGLTYS